MILADTSVWIDHLRAAGEPMAHLLASGRIVMHPFVLSELSLGSLGNRASVIRHLAALPMIADATTQQVLGLIERELLWSRGIGLVDAHLLAVCRLSPGTQLWTRDRRLAEQADRLGIGWSPEA